MEQQAAGRMNLHQQEQQPRPLAAPIQLQCPRCHSLDTKFCYYNNYNTNQPRHYCKTCKRHWTQGGALRNVPVGGNRRRRQVRYASSSNEEGSRTPPRQPPTPPHVAISALGGNFSGSPVINSVPVSSFIFSGGGGGGGDRGFMTTMQQQTYRGGPQQGSYNFGNMFGSVMINSLCQNLPSDPLQQNVEDQVFSTYQLPNRSEQNVHQRLPPNQQPNLMFQQNVRQDSWTQAFLNHNTATPVAATTITTAATNAPNVLNNTAMVGSYGGDPDASSIGWSLDQFSSFDL